MTRDRYKIRLAKFLDFIGIDGEIRQQFSGRQGGSVCQKEDTRFVESILSTE
jgi:hypothetical protein